MRRRSCTISPMRVAGTCSSNASLLTVRRSGFMKSSRRTSPGWTAGSNAWDFLMLVFLLMIIGNFHIEGMAITPHEADSPLVVDANRVLPFAITSQRFQMIAGRRSEDTQLGGSVELQQLAQRGPSGSNGSLLYMPGALPWL